MENAASCETTGRCRLLVIEVSKGVYGSTRRSFVSFPEADAFLAEEMGHQVAFSEKQYEVHVAWEGGLDFHGLLELLPSSPEDENGILVPFLRSSLEDELLLPPKGDDVDTFVSRASFHVRRMASSRRQREKARKILTSCEGMEGSDILAKEQLLLKAVIAFQRSFPLLKEVVEEGRHFLEDVECVKNRSTEFQKALLIRQKFPLSLAVSHVIRREDGKAQDEMRKAREVHRSFMEDASIIDERFTKLGQELYGLTSMDVNRLRDILVKSESEECPVSDAEVSEYLARDLKMTRRGLTHSVADIKEQFFLRFYRKGYIYRGIRSLRNRTDLTLYAASQVKLSGKGIGFKDIEQVIHALDPLAVHQPSYAPGILSYMDGYMLEHPEHEKSLDSGKKTMQMSFQHL